MTLAKMSMALSMIYGPRSVTLSFDWKRIFLEDWPWNSANPQKGPILWL